LNEVIKAQEDNPSVVSFVGMKNDLWVSLADSGELHWLDDLAILDAIANAYYHLRRIITLEEKYFDSGFKMAVSGRSGQTFAGAGTAEHTKALRSVALQAIEGALKSIGSVR
jgi:hypothetical protein